MSEDTRIGEGDTLPQIDIMRPDGTQVKPEHYHGKPLVLYFYPKGDTPGCTKEALQFTELRGEFDNLGAAILGVSKDPPAKHVKFTDKYGLKIDLASDENEMAEALGIWVEKNMYGRKYMGLERTTYLVDGDGKIARVWRKVKVKEHAEAVLEAAKAL
ncbi:peroxiredoxin [Sphingorhabdus sp. Alg239-R122]|uniref:peroxiredoxin n=1 Tax=Sphingorhabdus sp. Alg239-R122 TaxID=2305989 RepID=UPI0013DAD71D|nr:peroxiredoxin [Sphingorhabdus sp. Alg239-R122]